MNFYGRILSGNTPTHTLNLLSLETIVFVIQQMQMAFFHQQLVHYDLKYQMSGEKIPLPFKMNCLILRSYSKAMNFKLGYGGMSHWRISNLPFPLIGLPEDQPAANASGYPFSTSPFTITLIPHKQKSCSAHPS